MTQLLGVLITVLLAGCFPLPPLPLELESGVQLEDVLCTETEQNDECLNRIEPERCK